VQTADNRGRARFIQDDYIDSIKEQLIEITYDWCTGDDFETVCKKTDSYEGSIIRTWRRLHELLKDMSTASKEIGNEVPIN
jgi:ATP-dependent RNA helicase DOB1